MNADNQDNLIFSATPLAALTGDITSTRPPHRQPP
jgi:hypothetical protein